MVAVEVVQVLGLTLIKTPETLVDLVVAVAVVLASLQVMEVHKIQVDMEVQVLADLQTKMVKVKQVLTHLLTLAVMVAVVEYMEKDQDKQDLVETEEIESMLQVVELQEVQTEVVVDHQVVMDMV